MSSSRLDLLRWQFDLTWALFEYHLERLEPDDVLWEPAALTWTLHPNGSGTWTPDWAETEPDPVPVPTIAWVTWHIGWWWSTAAAHVTGATPPEREAVTWPGDAPSVTAWLRGLRDDWHTTLDGLTDAGLDAPAPEPWSTTATLVAWVNAELMKNAAEIGQLRLLRHARPNAPGPTA
ncbi:DinB family protein [Spirillospora sp. NPDC047279]|uniref:DinB family protein n=1 Tax=Spirillospora sp. NPDC047279 TaxID=3155478 RepID=UPI0033E7AF22